MFCEYCGKEICGNADYCMGCGAALNKNEKNNDSSSAAFGAIGFFVPIVGLILYILYGKKMPKRAKSAGKGALIGYITKLVLVTVFFLLYFTLIISMALGFSNGIIDAFNEVDYYNDLTEFSDGSVQLFEDCTVNIGEYTVFENQYFSQASLSVTVNNISDEYKTFAVTVNAYDENGEFINSDKVYTETISPYGSTELSLFVSSNYVDFDIYQYATFEVTDIYEI